MSNWPKRDIVRIDTTENVENLYGLIAKDLNQIFISHIYSSRFHFLDDFVQV